MKLKVSEVYREYHDGTENVFVVGQKDIRGKTPIRIIEREPQGDGDVHYCMVEFDDGSAIKICRPDYVAYDKEADT